VCRNDPSGLWPALGLVSIIVLFVQHQARHRGTVVPTPHRSSLSNKFEIESGILLSEILPLVAVSPARWGHATRAHAYDREPASSCWMRYDPGGHPAPGVVARTGPGALSSPVSGADGLPQGVHG
jgi:hypothetical protein